MRAHRSSIALVCACAVALGCGRLDIGVDVPDATPSDAGSDTDSAAGESEAGQCLPPDHGWPGCAVSGCAVCSDLVKEYPLYFENHERCEPTDDCHGHYATCSTDCPEPAETDQCNHTSGEWNGCRGSGCWVCTELVKAYPKYFDRHRNCIRNDGCEQLYFECSAACPAPTSADR